MKKHFFIFPILIISFSANVVGNWQHKVDSITEILPNLKSDSAKADAHFQIAEELLLNEPTKAYGNFLQVIEIGKKINNQQFVFDGLVGLSDYFSLMNDFQSALEYLFTAKNIAGDNLHLQSFCHSRLSEAYYFADDLDQSIHHAWRAHKLNQELKDTAQFIYDYHNLASWHLEMDNFDSSLYYLYMALDIFHHKKEEPTAVFYSHIGQTYTYMNEFDSALFYHFKAMEIDKANGSMYEIAVDENYIGLTYQRIGKYDEAIKYANRSLSRAEQLKLDDVKYFNYDLLKEAYSGKGEFAKALEYSDLRNNYADTLRDKNKESIIQGLNAKYSLNEQQQKLSIQEAENRLLRKQKTLLMFLAIVGLLFVSSLLFIVLQISQKHKTNRKLLAELEKANSAKEKLISVISHDLRSSIGTLRNSIMLIVDDSIDQESISELLESFYPVVDSTYDLLENLLTWAAYNKGNLEPSIEKIDIRPIIEKSIQHTHHLADSKNIEIVNRVENELVKADKNMLSTVLRNLISNAVKFSHPKSKVTITSLAKNNMALITIKDDGIGMKPKTLETLFTIASENHSIGTRGERGSGLGLSICKNFIEEQGGTIQVNSTHGIGSTFTFTIPVFQQN